MADRQLWLMIGVPVLCNAAMLTVATIALCRRIERTRARLEAKLAALTPGP